MDPHRSTRDATPAVIPFPPLRHEADRRSDRTPPLRLDGPRALDVERWRWTGLDDAFVLTARVPETGERIRFAAPLTPAVRSAIERREPCAFALRAVAVNWEVEASASDVGRPAVRDAAALDAWADRALDGDAIARRLVARAAARLAHLAAAGGPAQASVHLASVGESFGGPFADAAYWLRGTVAAYDAVRRLGPAGEVWRGDLDVGRWIVPVELILRGSGERSRSAPGPEAGLSARVVFHGAPPDAGEGARPLSL